MAISPLRSSSPGSSWSACSVSPGVRRFSAPPTHNTCVSSRGARAEGQWFMPTHTKLRASKYLNKLIGQGNRGVKAAHVMLGLTQFECGGHDRRRRADAPHPQGAVRATTSQLSRSCSLERSTPGLKGVASGTRTLVLPIGTGTIWGGKFSANPPDGLARRLRKIISSALRGSPQITW